MDRTPVPGTGGRTVLHAWPVNAGEDHIVLVFILLHRNVKRTDSGDLNGLWNHAL